jgi:hypothetical protein
MQRGWNKTLLSLQKRTAELPLDYLLFDLRHNPRSNGIIVNKRNLKRNLKNDNPRQKAQ